MTMRNAPFLLLCLLLLVGCARPTRSANSGRTDGTLSPQEATLAPGNYDLAMTIAGLERTYILHVPTAVAQNEPSGQTHRPLIIVLHGTYGTGRKMQLGLGFDAYADARGFYVAYPDAYQEPGERQTARWNDGRGTLASSTQGIDDVAFLTSLVDEIGRQVMLDKSRVFVTGASNGGMMAYRLGCETSGIFAGIAPVIGNIPEPIFAACNPSAPLSFLAINGDADPFIPFAGGEVCGETPSRLCEGGLVMSQSESVARFAAANGCEGVPETAVLPTLVADGTSIEVQTYAHCANDAQVVAYVVHHGGHTWPPRESQLAAGGQSTGNLAATSLIVDFFLALRRPF